jgi:hypothetical protein
VVSPGLNRSDATFCPQPGKNGKGNSFHAVNYPTKYIRHYYGKIYIAGDGAGTNPWDTTALWTDDTSFIAARLGRRRIEIAPRSTPIHWVGTNVIGTAPLRRSPRRSACRLLVCNSRGNEFMKVLSGIGRTPCESLPVRQVPVQMVKRY